jgi:hypothetical protein
MIDHFVLITILVLSFLCWFHGQKMKEIAYRATREHCQTVQVQMLDEYIAGNGLWLKRDKTGKIRWQRTFLFEFTSTGEQRYNGKIIMLGDQVESITMEPYRIDWS